jgi:hypothetical protein
VATAAPQVLVPRRPDIHTDVKIYSHSPLLYWWPVWAVAFVMALWTFLDNRHLVLVPEHTEIRGNVLVAPEGAELDHPFVHVARSRIPGVAFVLTLLAVVILTHVWLRGPWALFIAALAAALVLFVSWLAWWRPLSDWFGLLRVHINLGGYLAIAVPLLAAWALTVFVLDRRTYLIFSVGQIRIRDELGEQEKAFDTTGVTFEKRPYDWFRWLVGGGAGDMILRTGGAHPQVFELANVVRVGKWLQFMEERLRTRDVA